MKTRVALSLSYVLLLNSHATTRRQVAKAIAYGRRAGGADGGDGEGEVDGAVGRERELAHKASHDCLRLDQLQRQVRQRPHRDAESFSRMPLIFLPLLVSRPPPICLRISPAAPAQQQTRALRRLSTNLP